MDNVCPGTRGRSFLAYRDYGPIPFNSTFGSRQRARTAVKRDRISNDRAKIQGQDAGYNSLKVRSTWCPLLHLDSDVRDSIYYSV